MEKALSIGAVVVLLAAIIVVVVLLQTRAAKKRKKAWQAEAERLGFSYLESDPDFVGREEMVDLFGVEDESQFMLSEFSNIFSGVVQSFGVVLAKYRGMFGGLSHEYSICVLHLPGANLPQFRVIRRHGLAERLPFGKAKEVDFSEDPRFAHELVVQGEDHAPIKQVMHPSARQALLGYSEGNLNLSAKGDRVMLSLEKVLAPDQIKAFIDQVVPLATVLAAPRS